MLWIGVIIASSVIPLVMEMLFNVYGIGDVLPRPGMSMAEALPAPPAAMVAAITQGVFNYSMPWNMVFSGGVLALVLLLLNKKLKKKNFELSVLGVATGMYLPLATTFPIFMGALLSYCHKRKLATLNISEENKNSLKRKAVLVACGLVSGAALMDVLLAIPFSLVNNPDLFRLLPSSYEGLSELLGFASLAGLVFWFYGYSTKE
jgi:putative OPT family oligopeptide transporter